MVVRFAVLLAVALAATSAHAQESRLEGIQKSGVLRVCTPGDYRPFSLARPDGSYEGLDVDLVQSMDPSKMPFDGKRMFWGGFETIIGRGRTTQ